MNNLGLRILYYFTFLIFFPNIISAQCWIDVFGNSTELDIGSSVIETRDSGLVMTGKGLYNVVKTDKDGNVKWTKSFLYDSPDCESIQSVIETEDGGLTFCGYIDFITTLIHTDSVGNVIWKTTYDSVSGYGPTGCFLLRTNDHGYFICHSMIPAASWCTTPIWNYKRDSVNWLIKTDSIGNVQWSKALDHWIITSIVETADSCYILTQENVDTLDVNRLKKIDVLGNEIWSKQLPVLTNGYNVISMGFGGIIVVGKSDLSHHPFITKFDLDGIEKWSNEVLIPNDCIGYTKIKKTKSGNFVLAVSEVVINPTTFQSSSICAIIITDSLANFLCSNRIAYRNDISKNDLILTNDGGIVITGFTKKYSEQGFWDMFLLKADTLCSCILIDSAHYPPEITHYFNINSYPNPVRDYLTIEYSTDYVHENINLLVYDITGRIVKQMQFNFSLKIFLETSFFAQGIYSFEVLDNNMKQRYGKGRFVVVH